jgi:hypothetical protein
MLYSITQGTFVTAFTDDNHLDIYVISGEEVAIKLEPVSSILSLSMNPKFTKRLPVMSESLPALVWH